MKILYIAVHSHVGWGAEYWLKQAFNDQGTETILYNYRKARKQLKPWWIINLELRHLYRIHKPDLIFLQRAEKMPPSTLAGLNAPKVFWSTEPIQLKNCVDRLLRSSIFDWVFLHSYSCLERVKVEFPHLLSKSSIMHNASPAPIIDKTVIKSRFGIFNRTMSPRREAWLSPSKELLTFEHGKYGEEYFEALAISEVAPNVHFSDENIDDFESGIFEAMAKGCVVVSERLNPQTVADLHMQNAYIEVSSPKEMQEALSHLQNNPDQIAAYKEKSYRAIEHNTWHIRTDLFLDKFKEIIAAKE